MEEQEVDELYAPVPDPRVMLRIRRCRIQGHDGSKPRRLALRLVRKSRTRSSAPLVSAARKSKSNPSSL